MNDFLAEVNERILILDGAMGTMLQARGLAAGAAPESMNLEQPDIVSTIHREYVAAAADIIETNTFGANRPKLSNYGLEDRVAEINSAAVAAARSAAGAKTYIAGSVGPTGRFVEPVGDAGFDEMVEIFAEQLEALVAAGVDLINFETFLDIRELRAAIVAAKAVSELPLVAMMTFDNAGRTVLGTSPAAAAVTLDALGVDVIGANCGLGIEGIYSILTQMRAVTPRPLIAQANAGLPVLRDKETVFPGTPEEMTLYHERLIKLGVRIIGGCCGTTPQHIEVMQAGLQQYDQRWQAPPRKTFLSSRTGILEVGAEAGCCVIGERINPTGKKTYTAELRAGKTAYIRREAQEQVAAGADLLDINCGAPGVDEPLAMERAVFAVSGVAEVPLVLDSSSPATLERGLKAADGKVLINSVSGEDKSLQEILPLAKKYGAAVIGLALDGRGIPETAADRVAVAERILHAAEACGLPREDLFIDCLTLTVSAEQSRALETLQAMRQVREKLQLATVLGVSNISFGLPQRPIISATFFSMALEAGLQAAIINPKEERMMAALRAAKVLLCQDLRADRYIFHYGRQAEGATKIQQPVAEAGVAAIRERLGNAILEGDRDAICPLVEEAIAEGLDPLQISNEGLLPGLEEVGRRFGKNQLFLPQVMLAAETMQIGFKRLREEFKDQAIEPLGKILMATVEGDIHDIGKNIVSTLLENHGFEVIDLGKNVPLAKIIEQAKAHQVDAVGLSALMTTTLQQMEMNVEALRQAGVKVFTMVGGAVVTQAYADEIGADLYAADALEAVTKIKELLRADR